MRKKKVKAKKSKKISRTKPKKRLAKKARPKARARKVKARAKKAVPKKTTETKPIAPPGVSLQEIGIITHYFPKVEAAVIKMTKGFLSIGDTIFIKGHTTDFKQSVESLQLEHAPITTAEVNQEVGLKVSSRVRQNDVVYKVVS